MLEDSGKLIYVHEKGQIRSCCPFCATRGYGIDTGYHLYFYTRTGTYHCFRCLAHGKSSSSSINDIEMLNGKKDDDIEQIKEKLNNVGILKTINPNININNISRKLDRDKTPFAYEYLQKRDLIKYVDKMNIRVGIPYIDEETGKTVGKWEGRILFPYSEFGNVKYVIGRSYVNDIHPKYLNSEGQKSYVLYGYNHLDQDKCIVCEGVISAIRAQEYTGIPAIAVLGKTFSDFQIFLLSTKVKEIYLSLDGDVPRDQRLEAVRNLSKHFIVKYVDLDEGDPDELGPKYLEYFNKAKTYLEICGERI